MATMNDNSTYWIVAVPNTAHTGNTHARANVEPDHPDDVKATQRQIDMKTAKLSDNFRFIIPKLRVGTLDSLMTLSDELGKIDTQVDSIVKKIERTYRDLKPNTDLTVDGNTPEAWCEEFKWNAAKFPPAAALNQLTQKIQQDAGSVEDELRKKTTRFSEVQQNLGAIERKETGTLLVKPLHGLIDHKKLHDGDFLTTLLLVIPKTKEADFLDKYEVMEERAALAEQKAEEERKVRGEQMAAAGVNVEKKEDKSKAAPKPTTPEEEELERRRVIREERAKKVRNIVPASARKLAEDAEFALYRIMVFKKGEDAVKNLCRQERYTVRSYSHDPDQAENERQSKNEMAQEKNQLQGALTLWCETTYSDLFASWIHLKAIRVFVESVLRYGIPVNFQVALLKPKKGNKPKLRRVLAETYGFLAGRDLTATDEDRGAEAAVGIGSEFFPYVYLTIDLEDER